MGTKNRRKLHDNSTSRLQTVILTAHGILHSVLYLSKVFVSILGEFFKAEVPPSKVVAYIESKRIGVLSKTKE